MFTPGVMVPVCLFLTGLGSMMMEMVWIRQFSWLFGVATRASAVVFGVFMVGQALGSLGWGRLLSSEGTAPSGDPGSAGWGLPRNPLALFRALAVGTAVTSALTPALLAVCRQAYLALGGELGLGPGLALFVRFLMAALVVGPPTVCMGGLFPAASTLLIQPGDVPRRALGLLSSVNLLGGAVGVLLVTFVGVEAWGFQRTLFLGCLFPLVAAVLIGMGTKAPGPTAARGKHPSAADPDLEPCSHAHPRPLPILMAFILGARSSRRSWSGTGC
ncbi:MAG: hypothetical protein GX442_07555 [Candidatus Riflebacteria bacterium]|nr:hypothetical protein [Candidatus Riflebacteria bacterium]